MMVTIDLRTIKTKQTNVVITPIIVVGSGEWQTLFEHNDKNVILCLAHSSKRLPHECILLMGHYQLCV